MKEKPVIINILRKQKPKEDVERTQEKIKNVKQDKKKQKPKGSNYINQGNNMKKNQLKE